MKYYKCTECGEVHTKQVQWCEKCCGVEFKTVDISVSNDADVSEEGKTE